MSAVAGGGGGGVEPSSNANTANVASNVLKTQSALSNSVSVAPTSSQLINSDINSGRSVDSQSVLVEEPKNDLDSKKQYDPTQATFRESIMRRSIPQLQGRNTEARNALISATGREFGPDIALKVVPNIDSVTYPDPDQYISKIITKDSSITEVLNILAFLLNNGKQRNGSVIDKFSYDGENSVKDVYNSLKDSLKDSAPFNITTLTTALGVSEGDKITIPKTILKRDDIYDLKKDIIIESKQIQPLISACILQMINILENTREVFGGWAKLFKGMQGGSSKSKTKKTRRRY